MSDKAIVYMLNNSFIEAFKISIFSLLKYNNINCDIVIFYKEDSLKKTLQNILSAFNNQFILKKIDSIKYDHLFFRSISREWLFNPAYRFEIFALEEYNSILYLDCDTLITGDISEILLNDCDFGACLLSPISMKYFSQGNGFNAGVLKIGRKYLSKKVRDTLILYCEDKKEISGNQIVLNKFFENKKTILPQKFNVTTDIMDKALLNEGIIYHFIGELKPWQNSFKNSFNSYVKHNTGIDLLLKIYLKYRQLEKQCSLFFNSNQ